MVKPFGAEYNEECAAIRQTLIDEGWDPKDPTMLFEITKRYQDNHKDDLTYRERQEQWKARCLTNAKSQPKSHIFDDEELAYLLGRLEFANDPVGQKIFAKLKE